MMVGLVSVIVLSILLIVVVKVLGQEEKGVIVCKNQE